ncbi:hypothetical protein RYX36_024192 [Vicia faba]
MTIQVTVDPLEWRISQDTANIVVVSLANTIGAAESVLRVASTDHDKLKSVKRMKVGLEREEIGFRFFILFFDANHLLLALGN